MSVEIVQGEDKTFSVKLTDGNGNDYDLTGFTEISAVFATTTTPLTVTQTGGAIVVSNPPCGKMDITLTDTETLTLASGTQDLEILIDVGTTRTIVQLPKQVIVKERLIS